MSRAFVVTRDIDRPVADVWRVLTDWDRAPAWMSGVDSVRAAGGTRVGDTLSFVARKRERTSEVTAVRPGESITLTSVQGPVRADYTYTVSVADGATRAGLVADVTVSGGLRVFAPVLRALIRRTDGGQLDALKRVVEETG